MAFKIQVQGTDIVFEAEPGEKILEAAERAGIWLQSGCRMGGCGMCKAKATEGTFTVGPHAGFALSEKEEADGVLLVCCSTANSDMTIQTTAHRMRPARRKVRVASVTFFDAATAQVMLETVDGKPLEYKTGQYITLRYKGKARSYSMASQPGDHLIELHIRHLPGGFFTDALFGGEIKAGDVFEFEGPQGDFWLRPGDREIIMVGNGTGAAPLIGIIEKLAAEGSQRKVTFVFGGRTRNAWYLNERIALAVRKLEGLRFVQVCSREPEWPGAKGHVQDVVLAEHPDMSNVDVYACGQPAMVEEARKRFIAAGLPAGRYFADAFTSERDIQ